MPEVTLILDNIRSTHNVGAIFRTAEGFGVEKLVFCGYTPYPAYPADQRLPHEADKISRQIHKTALGAETMVPFECFPTLADWLQSNQSAEQPLSLIGLEQDPRSVTISNFQPPSRIALLLGEEVSGIEPAVREICETLVEIPMLGQKESFNVSVAAGIALYALSQAT